jgi:hypothetical protein
VSEVSVCPSRDNTVGIVTGCGAGRPRDQDFSFPCCPDLFSYLCVPGALSLGVKQPGHEADHSPPTSAIPVTGRGGP